MKKLLVVLALALVLPSVSAAAETSFGIRGGMSIPTGDQNILWNPSLYFSLGTAITPKGGTIGAAFGATYASVDREEYSDKEQTRYLSLFAGPQFVASLTPSSKTTSLYFLPALTFGHAIYTGDSDNHGGALRIGIDLGAGLRVSLGKYTQFEIGSVFSMNNLLKKQGVKESNYYDGYEDEYVDENTSNLLNIHIGFIF